MYIPHNGTTKQGTEISKMGTRAKLKNKKIKQLNLLICKE